MLLDNIPTKKISMNHNHTQSKPSTPYNLISIQKLQELPKIPSPTKDQPFSICKGLSRRLMNVIKFLELAHQNQSVTSEEASNPERKDLKRQRRALNRLKCEIMPKISIRRYIKRIKKGGGMDDSVFVIAFILIKRAMGLVSVDSAHYIHKLLRFLCLLLISI